MGIVDRTCFSNPQTPYHANAPRQVYATFRPTFPTPLPTTLTTISPLSSSPPFSRKPQPLPPKTFESLANEMISSLASTSLPNATLPTSSDPMAMSMSIVGAAMLSTVPPWEIFSSSWYAHCLPISSAGTPPSGGEHTSALNRQPVLLSATKLSPKPTAPLTLPLPCPFWLVGMRGAGEASEKMYVSGTNLLRMPRASWIMRSLLLFGTSTQYATPLILFTRPGFRRCSVFGRRTW